MANTQWPIDQDSMQLLPNQEEDLTMLMESIPQQPGQEQLRQKGEKFLKTLSPPKRGRAPSLNEMGSGEIFVSGGVQGQGADFDPQLTITQPRDAVQEILSDSGYTDFVKSKDLKKRQKHIKKLKDITGISKIENEEDYLYGPGGKSETSDIDRMKGVERWLNASPDDKMLITQVAKGDIQPEQFRAFKTQQAIGEEQEVMKALSGLIGDFGTRGGYMHREGEPVPTTPENVGSVLRGERGAPGIGFSGSLATVRNVSSGGRGGRGGGGKSPKKPVSSLGKNLLDNEKLLKGDVEGFRKFPDDVADKIKGDNDILRTAMQLQTRAGGVARMSDDQAKAEAPGFIQTNSVVSDIVNDLNVNPLLKKELSGDPKESILYFKNKLEELPNKMYNRVVALLNKNHSFEDILKTLEDTTGGKPLKKATE